jgi:Pyruvate/2-oxoacid:ferredoxin oxidoreductase delta subunit
VKLAENTYERIAGKLMVMPSSLMIHILKMVMDPEDAELVLAMPGTPDQLSERVGKPAHELEAQCRRLYQKGVILKTLKEGKFGYRMHKDITMFRDATAHWVEVPKSYHDLWKRFMEEEWPGYARQEGEACPLPPGRVIPIERSLGSALRHQVLDAESLTKIIEKAEKLSVTECICRVIERKCNFPLETCLQVNHSATYMLDRGIGREISKQEAVELLTRCEEAGLVHMTLNKSSVDHFICNCCPCCCVALPLVIKEGLKLCNPSRYQAEIDPELCTSCGTCLERCHFGAIEKESTKSDVEVMRVNRERCMGCGLCNSTCPAEAIRLVEVRDAKFIPA